MKYSNAEILKAFSEDKPKKTTFGNFRIEKNTLIYRAQSSEDVRRWCDAEKFQDTRKKIQSMIRDFDGKLTQDGKTILLEGLTANSPNTGLRVQFYETNLIAHKVNGPNGPIFLGNSDVLDLIGRTVAYGNENRNNGWTEIQSDMRNRGFVMLPMKDFQKFDFKTFECLETSPELEVVVTDTFQLNRWKKETRPVTAKLQAMLFKLEGDTYLFDVDRREIKYNRVNTFVTKILNSVKTIDDAYQALKPKSVVDAEACGLQVKRMGRMFFIPVKAPSMPKLTIDERLFVLGCKATYGLENDVIEQLTGQALSSSEKRADELLKNIPQCGALDAGDRDIKVQTTITLSGVQYCTGKIESGNRAELRLNDWYMAIPRKGG